MSFGERTRDMGGTTMSAKVSLAFIRKNFRRKHLLYIAAGSMFRFLLGAVIGWALEDSEMMTRQERSWTTIALLGLLFTAWLIDDNIRNLQALYVANRLGYAWVW